MVLRLSRSVFCHFCSKKIEILRDVEKCLCETEQSRICQLEYIRRAGSVYEVLFYSLREAPLATEAKSQCLSTTNGS